MSLNLKRRFPLLVWILLLSTITYSQPGGGGGLMMDSIYTPDGKCINLLTDHHLQIRSFVMKNGKLDQETFLWEQLKKNNGQLRISRGHFGFGLPPTSSLANKYRRNEAYTQRLLITYKKTVMLIDFVTLMEENAGGYVDKMDSLCIMNGHYYFDRAKSRDHRKFRDLTKTQRKVLDHGLTESTIAELTTNGLLRKENKIDLAFLEEKNLGYDYYYQLAKSQYQEKKYEAANITLITALKKNGNLNTCEWLLLNYAIQTELKKYNEALEYLNQAMQCKVDNWSEQPYIEHLKERANLFTAMGRYSEALQDYDEMVVLSEYKIPEELERANFKIKVMNAPASSIADLKMFLENQQQDSRLKNEQLGYRDDNNEIYFTIGEAYYAMGQTDSAFSYYLMAEEGGYDNTSSWNMVNKYSILIQQHPYASKLYVARALAHGYRAPYLGWGDSTRIAFERALSDFDKAAQLGFSDYRIPMHKANYLNQLKRHAEAMESIELAITRNKNIIRNYGIRYQIRSNLGQTAWGNKNDPDQLIMTRLKKEMGLE